MAQGLPFKTQDVVVPLGFILLIGCMIIPVPDMVLDLLLCSNLLAALLLVLGALHIKDPLKIAALPSLLLMTTLFRLSLNLATTRAVLSTGHAGQAVEAFGSIVIQGSAVVGFVLFLLISLIQFIVVAKGAERVAEVSARFTLDALPGKQMAIDAEIRSGMLDPEAARKKRLDVQTESRFYGALDGAMKFVKGDAIAGLIITFVNICGGLLVGILINGLDVEVALRRYTVLTIGDGLLSQIPSLLNSVAAGLVVTRVQVDENTSLSSDLLSQLAQFKAARLFVAIAAAVLGCVPGMPHVALFVVSGLIAFSFLRGGATAVADDNQKPFMFEPTLPQPLHLEVARVSLPCLPGLQEISNSLEQLRSYAFAKWGLVLKAPGVSVWEESPGGFRILVRGMEVYRREFGAAGESSSAENGGADSPFWDDVVREARLTIDHYKLELIDDGVTRQALDYVERQVPDLVSGVVPSPITLTYLTGLLRTLLREGVTVKHLDVILQACAESGAKLSERGLVAEIRVALAPVISAAVAERFTIYGVALDPLLDLAVARAEESESLLPQDVVQGISAQVEEITDERVVVMASRRARAYLRDVLRVRGISRVVIAHEEVAARYEVVQVGRIEIDDSECRSAILESLAA